MKCSVIEIEEEYFNENNLASDWGFFVDLDVPPKKTPVKPLKTPTPEKYNRIYPAQVMDTINEETKIDFSNENLYSYNNIINKCNGQDKTDTKTNTNKTKTKNKKNEKREKIIKFQIYSGVVICALATYICFTI
jgi:hypothetical protein